MTDAIATVEVSFEALVKALSALSLKDKNRLYEILYEQIEQEEEDLMEQDPAVRARMEAARAAITAGDYVTLEEIVAERAKSQE
ncbi:MAG: hypothetical protein IT324_28980 [Anaerolineae bacterium]|nr:hypothetical protein [Anaerolineae bacterium]